ncbi:hypothetical protein NHQ30_009821 [Ciborinia camelliae]|nr:hypothetical protein NHQ30_009821 [Ciborinia camelliae]
MDVEFSAYQDFTTPLPELSGDFEASVHNSGFSNELFADVPLNLDDTNFGNFFGNFQSEQNGDDALPDCSDLVNIAEQHVFDLDTNMMDNAQLDDSAFDNLLESCEATLLEIRAPASAGIHNPITDIAAWGDTLLSPLAVLDVPTPRRLSRAGSANSTPSEHSQSQGIDIIIKPSLNRSESSLSNTPLSYQEGVFSSTPGLSSVPTTYGSSPRRMGPLDSVTRTKANAVKAIGACWRCRFLRKPCNAQKCCSQCEGKQGGPWHSIGCKRGDIKNRMLPITLCPKKTVGSSHSSAISDMHRPWLYANHCCLELFEQRGNDLLPGIMSAPNPTKVDEFLQDLETGRPLLIGLQRTRLPLMERFNKTASAILKPLAVYQASVGSNQLIAYSLTCLRSCIEALHVNGSGCLGGSHEACELSTCKVDCIRNIELQLEQYLDELSRVIFLKENMRSRIWWLSEFYSLCIQGVIRQALILLTSNRQGEVSKTAQSGPIQYLHIAIRLFTVSSGKYDPLIQDWSSEFAFPSMENVAPSIEDYQNAQLATKQSEWRLKGIKKSETYLKKLFEDNGGVLAEPDDESANFTILPEPYLPETFTLETCRQLRADWDLARCNYTKNISQVMNNYGHESKAYTDAEEKWKLVEAEWKKFNDETLTHTVSNAHNRCAIPRSSSISHETLQVGLCSTDLDVAFIDRAK